MICIIKQIPRREPKFHHDEMLEGAGRSINALLTIFSSGWDFRILVIKVLIVELQRWFFMSLVVVRVHVGIYDDVHCIYFEYYICNWVY